VISSSLARPTSFSVRSSIGSSLHHILFSKFGEQTDRCTAFSATFQKTVSYTSTEDDIAWSVSTNEVTEKRTDNWTQSKYPIPLPFSTESGILPGFRISHGNYVSFLLHSSSFL
jgi:hypothetical protein